MIREKKVTNDPVRGKISPLHFFKTHILILRELCGELPLQTIGILLLSSVTVGISLVELKLLEFVTNQVADYFSEDQNHIITFAALLGLFFAGLLALHILQMLYEALRERYQSEIVFRSEKKMISKLASIPYEYYESNQFHEKINLAKGASGQYANAVYGVTELFCIMIKLIVYGYMLNGISSLFALLVIAAILLCAFAAGWLSDKQMDFWRAHVSPVTRRNTYFRGVFGNRIRQAYIQNSRGFPFFGRKYVKYNESERKNYLKLNLFAISTELCSLVLLLITFGATALAVGRGVVSGKYEIGYFSMVIALIVDLFATIKAFSMIVLNGNWYVRVLSAYYELLSLHDSESPQRCMTNNAIELRRLEYQYPQSETNALSGVDASFHMGEKVALVGLNGSGKTTLISIVLGLLNRYEGIYGQNNVITTAILQDFGQYQMSVKENLEIGRGGCQLQDDEAIDILKKVGLYDSVATMPDGIHTKLGQLEGGMELSKGQWQRLAIGRLLANPNANVWILDEPTAYLDPVAEVDMYRFIFSLAGDRLVFFISHRLGFAKFADRIVVIDHGTIAEDGTHDELMKQNGLYAEMFEAQKEWYA